MNASGLSAFVSHVMQLVSFLFVLAHCSSSSVVVHHCSHNSNKWVITRIHLYLKTCSHSFSQPSQRFRFILFFKFWAAFCVNRATVLRSQLVITIFPTVVEGSEVSMHFLWPYLGEHRWRVSSGKAFGRTKMSFCLSTIRRKISKRCFHSSWLRHVHRGNGVLLQSSDPQQLWHTQQQRHFTLDNCQETQVNWIFFKIWFNCMKMTSVV